MYSKLNESAIHLFTWYMIVCVCVCECEDGYAGWRGTMGDRPLAKDHISSSISLLNKLCQTIDKVIKLSSIIISKQLHVHDMKTLCTIIMF